MGLSAVSFARMRSRLDTVLGDIFPAVLLYQGVQISASGPGGRAHTDYIEGGEAPTYRFPFRVPTAAAALISWVPAMGDSIDWIISPTQILSLEIIETAVRPADTSYSITCRPRRR